MTDCSSKKGKKSTRHILTAACVAAFGLMVTTGVRAHDADLITPPPVPDLLKVEDGNEASRGHGVGTRTRVRA
jgi:hypothetical protein